MFATSPDFAVQIGAFVVVQPVKARPDLTTQRVWVSRDRTLKVEISNAGNRHFAASKGVLDVTLRDGSGKTLLDTTMDGDDLRTRMGIGYIPPQGTRVLTIPLNVLVSEGTIPLVAAGDVQVRVQ